MTEILEFLIKAVPLSLLALAMIVPVIKKDIRAKKAKEERKKELDYLAKKIAEEQNKQ